MTQRLIEPTTVQAGPGRSVRRLVSMLARRGFPQGMAFEVVKEQLDRAGAETDGLFDET